MRMTVLASGSKGNSTVIASAHTRIPLFRSHAIAVTAAFLIFYAYTVNTPVLTGN